jgi:hypothetical protein
MLTASNSSRDTLARCQLKIARLYRTRAREALAKARAARKNGQDTAYRGYLSELAFWRAYASLWAGKARSTLAAGNAGKEVGATEMPITRTTFSQGGLAQPHLP